MNGLRRSDRGFYGSYLRVISEGHLGTIWGPVWWVPGRVILGRFWVDSEVNSDPILGNLIKYTNLGFIWP